MKIGGNANGSVLQVSSDPDGTLTAQRGTLAIDTTTGVKYENEDGGTSWWPSRIPGRMGWMLEDDCITTLISTFTNIGGGGWASIAVGSANPGQRTGTVSAAGVDGACCRSGGNSLLQLGAGKYRFRFIGKLGTLSDGTNNQIVRIGAGDGTTTFGDHVDGCYFEYDFATNGNHNWYICGASNSVRTKTSTGIAATTNLVRLELVVSAACDLLSGKIDGVATPTVSTNLPSGAGRQLEGYAAVNNKQLGSSSLTFTVDRIEANQVLTVSR